MKTIADMLKERVRELGFDDIKECARKMDLPYELLRKVISDGHIPKEKTLMYYAEVLGLDAAKLIGTSYKQKAPLEVQHIFEGASITLPAEGAHKLVPVVGQAACGEWLESHAVEPDIFEPVDILDPDAFFVSAEGDSMVGGNIPSGAFLLVSPAARVTNGNIVLARKGEDAVTVKTYHRTADGNTILQPMNPAYEPLLVPQTEQLTVMRITEIRIKL